MGVRQWGMPKPLKKTARPEHPKRPTDPNQLARQLVDESTAEPSQRTRPPAIPPDVLSAYMSELGRKGGKVGGKRRLETMTHEQRSAIALKAARARWAKRKRP
jgi:hypothetical protein